MTIEANPSSISISVVNRKKVVLGSSSGKDEFILFLVKVCHQVKRNIKITA